VAEARPPAACPRCPRKKLRPKLPGHSKCGVCLREAALSVRELRRIRREHDLCPTCGERPQPDRVQCARCAKQKSNQEKARRRERTRLGLCWRCPDSAEEGSVLCRKHLDHDNARKKASSLAS